MTWFPIAFLPPQYETPSGIPYSGAVLKAYAAGTTTVIPMATGYTGVTTAASIALNASGYPTYGGNVIIPHVTVNYKLALYPTQAAADANSGALWTVDDIQIADSTNTPFVEYFDGDGTTTAFNLSEDLGTDEKVLMVFADRQLLNHVSNGTFTSDTGWTKGAGWTIGAGVATAVTASSALLQNSNTEFIPGVSYTLTYTITRSAGDIIPVIGSTNGTTRSASGTYTETIVASAAQAISFSGTAFSGTVDNVTVKPTYAAQRQILRPLDEYTLVANTLTLAEAPPVGTKNVIVFAPSLLLGAANNAAAAAATSETNAAASAAAAAASAASLVGLIGVTIQGFDADLSAIGAIAGTSGHLKKTAANTWSLDTLVVDGPASASASGLALFDGTTGKLLKQSTLTGFSYVTSGVHSAVSLITAAYLDSDAVTTVKILNDNVTYAKIQNVSATDKLLGRSTAGAGDVEEIACTAAGRALLDDADAAAQRTTLGLNIYALAGITPTVDFTIDNSATAGAGIILKVNDSLELYGPNTYMGNLAGTEFIGTGSGLSFFTPVDASFDIDRDFIVAADDDITMYAGDAINITAVGAMNLMATGAIRIGQTAASTAIGAALSSTATTGHFWIPTSNGAATGAAAEAYINAAALIYDRVNNKLMVRCGATWRATAALT